MPNVLSPRDLVSRPDNMDKTVLLDSYYYYYCENTYCVSINMGNKLKGIKNITNLMMEIGPGIVHASKYVLASWIGPSSRQGVITSALDSRVTSAPLKIIKKKIVF